MLAKFLVVIMKIVEIKVSLSLALRLSITSKDPISPLQENDNRQGFSEIFVCSPKNDADELSKICRQFSGTTRSLSFLSETLNVKDLVRVIDFFPELNRKQTGKGFGDVVGSRSGEIFIHFESPEKSDGRMTDEDSIEESIKVGTLSSSESTITSSESSFELSHSGNLTSFEVKLKTSCSAEFLSSQSKTSPKDSLPETPTKRETCELSRGTSRFFKRPIRPQSETSSCSSTSNDHLIAQNSIELLKKRCQSSSSSLCQGNDDEVVDDTNAPQHYPNESRKSPDKAASTKVAHFASKLFVITLIIASLFAFRIRPSNSMSKLWKLF